MQDLSEDYILMVEPDKISEPSENPVKDALTQKVVDLYGLTETRDYGYIEITLNISKKTDVFISLF